MKTVIVLGGGGVKGLAHVGAWRAIRDAGIEVSEIVGTSIGAFVGAAVSAGVSCEELAARGLAMAKRDIAMLNRWALLLNGIRQPSVFVGETLRQYIGSIVPASDWSALRIPLGINAVSLERGCTEWFGVGGRTDVALEEAIYASCALPLFYPPAEIGDEHYVDGGVLDALPVNRARERGAELVIAIDATSGGTADPADIVSKGMVAIHHRVMDLVGAAHRRAQLAEWSGPRLVHVKPRLAGYSTFEFARTSYFIEEGYRATREALEREGLSDAALRA